MDYKKAQGSLEYLLILAAAVLICAVVIIALSNYIFKPDNSPYNDSLEDLRNDVHNNTVSTIGTAVRTLPAAYTFGVAVPVSILVKPLANTTSYGVIETYPSGWVVSNVSCVIVSTGASCSPADYSLPSGQIQWVFTDGLERNLTYTVTPPIGTIGEKIFSGGFDSYQSASYTSVGITGNTRITNTALAAGSAVRTLPTTYSQSNPFAVSIAVVPVAGTTVYGVAETYPSGWVVSDVNCLLVSTGNYCSVSDFSIQPTSIEWGFTDGLARVLTYTITPNAFASGVQSFSATLENYVDSQYSYFPVTGSTTISS